LKEDSTPFRGWLRPDLPLLACVALVPALLFSGHPLKYHDAARIAQIGFLLLAALALLASAVVKPTAPGPIGRWYLLAAGSLAAASVATSAVPAQAMREVAVLLGVAAAALAAVRGLEGDALRRARWAVWIGAGAQALVMLLFLILGLTSGQPLSWQEMAIGYDNFRILNHTQTIALPLLALLAATEKRGTMGWRVTWAILLVHALYVWCSGARGTALALVAAGVGSVPILGTCAVWPTCRNLFWAAAGSGAVYGVVFILLPMLGLVQLPQDSTRSMQSLASDSARIELWVLALDQAASAPVLGVGPMHYAHQPNPKAAHPHNFYLQVAAEWGMPMLLLLLALTGKALWRFAKAIRTEPAGQRQIEGCALFVTLLAILTDAMVSGNFVMPVSQMWIALCVAWSWAWLRASAGTAAAAAPEPGSRLVALVLLASQLWLVWAMWPEATDLQAHLEHIEGLVHNTRTNPRFWSHGWF
jgi:O-antigen ligase